MAAAVRMKSAVNWAVLGLVIERPSYGYELFQRLERRFDGVLDPQISQIYAALDVLERSRMIEPLEYAEAAADTPARRAPRRQPKVQYRATAHGARAFRGWVAEQMRADPQHIELLRRIAAVAGTGSDRVGVMRELVDHYEQVCVDEASRLPLPSARAASGSPAAAAAELSERLVLAARRGLLDAHFAWIDYARKELEAFAPTRPGAGDEPAEA